MDLKLAVQELARDIEDEIIRRLRSSVGINPCVGYNTLVGSRLEESIHVNAVDKQKIVFQIADYYEYVVNGWQPSGRLWGTKKEFIANIIEWAREKNVTIGNMTKNQIAYYLYNRMVINGREIEARPFIESGYYNKEKPEKILPFLDRFFERWADKVFELIMQDTDNYFNAA